MMLDIKESEQFLTEQGDINGLQTVSILNNYLAYYAFTKNDLFTQDDTTFHKLDLGNSNTETLNTTYKPSSQANKEYTTFTLDQYSLEEFYRIILDSRATGILSIGEQQVHALQKRDLSI